MTTESPSQRELKAQPSESSARAGSPSPENSDGGSLGFWAGVIGALPKLKTGIQLVGFVVLVAGFVSYKEVAQDKVPGVIATGGIGLLLLIFGLLLWLIGKVKTLQEPKFVSTLFAMFCCFILALFFVSVYYLGQSAKPADRATSKSENPPGGPALIRSNSDKTPAVLPTRDVDQPTTLKRSEGSESPGLRKQDQSGKELSLILVERHKIVMSLIDEHIQSRHGHGHELLDEEDLVTLKEIKDRFAEMSDKIVKAVNEGNWVLYHELNKDMLRYFSTDKVKKFFDNGFQDKPDALSAVDLLVRSGPTSAQYALFLRKRWLRAEIGELDKLKLTPDERKSRLTDIYNELEERTAVPNDLVRVYYESLPRDLAEKLVTWVPSIDLFRKKQRTRNSPTGVHD